MVPAPRPAAVLVLALAVLLGAPAAPPVQAEQPDGLEGVWSIMPPGADGTLNAAEALAAQDGALPPHVADQLDMYGDLVYEDATPGMTEGRLTEHFKVADLDVPEADVLRRYRPAGRDDVEIARDTFGIPHVTGDTREAAMFGQGYASAEDRLFLMDALRRAGRAELAAWLGPSSGNLAMDADVLAKAPYTESDLTAQLERLAASGPEGAQVVADIAAYVEGITAYVAEARTDPEKLPAEYLALQLLPEDFVPEDVVANSAFIGGIFGGAGGMELRNLCQLGELGLELGPDRARQVMDDLRFADDAEAPTTTDRRFTFLTDLGPVAGDAVPDVDCASLEPLSPEAVPGPDTTVSVPALPTEAGTPRVADAPWGELPLRLPDAHSNALLVGAEHTDTGAPIAVMGPQTGYFIPQLFWERSVRAPGLLARGVGIAGGSGYISIGRGADYAWSVTSANGDNVDIFVLALCEPDGGEATTDSMGYERDGGCVEIEAHEKVLVAKPGAGGLPSTPEELEQTVIRKYFERAPHYGPLSARGTLRDGTPIAVVRARTTYQDEVSSGIGFLELNDPGFMRDGVEAFRVAMGRHVGYSYSWFYADRRDIGFQMSCDCRERTDGIDPDLPMWGTGAFDWGRRLGMDELPHEVNPARGFLVNWNNKQAPGWRAADSTWGWGPVHRSQLLERRIDAALAVGPVSVGQVVDAAQLAATTDLRGQEVVPPALRLLDGGRPADVDERAEVLVGLLEAWIADGAHRRDHDRDGRYEHATAIAAMDAWWEPLHDGIFDEATAGARHVFDQRLHDDHIDGSAFQDSLYAHVEKDLRQALGDPVADPFSRTHCGGGDPTACGEVVWRSLGEAVERLAEEFGSETVEDWQRRPEDEAIRHSAIGLASVPAIPWQNRPTYQQVSAFPPPAPAPAAAPVAGPVAEEPPTPATRLPATGGGPLLLGLLLLAGGALARSRSARRLSAAR